MDLDNYKQQNENIIKELNKKHSWTFSIGRFSAFSMIILIFIDLMIFTDFVKTDANEMTEAYFQKFDSMSWGFGIGIFLFGIVTAICLGYAYHCSNEIKFITQKQKRLEQYTLQEQKRLEQYTLQEQKRIAFIKQSQDSFVLVSDFVQTTPHLDNEICGCYVLRNNNNNKYYVGQSKHIRQRQYEHWFVQDHQLIEPKNHIFSRDWYYTPEEERLQLFSIHIVPCKEEDLNRTERELIQLYNAYEEGYNSTAGNQD